MRKNFLTAIDRIRYKQKFLLITLTVIVTVSAIAFFIYFLSSAEQRSQEKSYKARITSGSSRIDPKEVWVEKFSAEQEITAKRMDNLEKMLETLIKLNQPHPSEMATTSSAESLEKLPNGDVRVDDLKASIKESFTPGEFVTEGSVVSQNASVKQIPNEGLSKPIQGTISNTNKHRSKGIHRVSISLTNNRSNKALKTNDNTIPAGAFAQAVLLGGVDASTSIQASSDPRPVLLRITDSGTLPRKFKSDLCDCHALAACFGDISSERVFMRLEKVTCTERKTGEIVEMNASGYVAGEDGRAGLRGHVVDRAGEIMRNAAIGGFLSGMGNFLSQSHNPITFSPANGLAQTNPLTNGDLLKHGASKGASSALDKYADFYIKRAEQMQPVIQVQAGRVADIVFTQGVAFEDSAARGHLIKANDQQRHAQIQNDQEKTQTPLDMWVPKHEENR